MLSSRVLLAQSLTRLQLRGSHLKACLGKDSLPFPYVGLSTGPPHDIAAGLHRASNQREMERTLYIEAPVFLNLISEVALLETGQSVVPTKEEDITQG